MNQTNEALVRRLFDEVWNQGHIGNLDALYAPDFVAHYRHPPHWGRGPDGVKQVVLAIRHAFPDYRETIEDLIADGDNVVARITIEGTHMGHLGPIPPTGRSVKADEIVIFRIASGKVAEQWGVPDLLTFYWQLGAVPALPW
jgi:predicted ester cyclase